MNNPNLVKSCCDVCVAVACFCFCTLLITMCSFLSLTGRWRQLIGIPVWEHTWLQCHNCGGLYTSCSHQKVKYLFGRISGLSLTCFWIIWRFLAMLLSWIFCLQISSDFILFFFGGGGGTQLSSSLKSSLSCLGTHLLSVSHTAFHCVKTASFWMSKWCRQPEWCWSSRSPAYRGWQVRARSPAEENKTTHH